MQNKSVYVRLCFCWCCTHSESKFPVSTMNVTWPGLVRPPVKIQCPTVTTAPPCICCGISLCTQSLKSRPLLMVDEALGHDSQVYMCTAQWTVPVRNSNWLTVPVEEDGVDQCSVTGNFNRTTWHVTLKWVNWEEGSFLKLIHVWKQSQTKKVITKRCIQITFGLYKYVYVCKYRIQNS